MSKFKLLLVSAFGNALEFYDFTLYGVFAAVIATHFFPSTDPTAALLASWGAFGAGFLMRPFGGSIFGYIGDKFGRKRALTLSIILMGVPTLIIGLVPDYHSIGLWAPMILFLCRLLQGICTGGEYNGAAIYALEHMGKSYPGFAGGLITGSCVVGALAATYLGRLVLGEGMPHWAWRIPFIMGAFISFIGFYIRRDMRETPDFEALKAKSVQTSAPLLQAITRYPASFITTAALGGMNGALSYTLFGFLSMYLCRYFGMPMTEAMKYSLFGLMAFMLSSPLMGYVMDKIGHRLYFLLITLTAAAAVWPIFTIFQTLEPCKLIIGQISLGILTGSIAGPMHAFIQNLFPVQYRYSGVSFSFSLGMGIIGGLTPLILTHFIETTQNMFTPAIWLSSCAIVCWACIIMHSKNLKA